MRIENEVTKQHVKETKLTTSAVKKAAAELSRAAKEELSNLPPEVMGERVARALMRASS